MVESAVHLADHVFPEAPVRQSVLTKNLVEIIEQESAEQHFLANRCRADGNDDQLEQHFVEGTRRPCIDIVGAVRKQRRDDKIENQRDGQHAEREQANRLSPVVGTSQTQVPPAGTTTALTCLH